MATLSSILACRIPWVEELGGLQSMGSQHHNPIVSRKSKICIFGEKNNQRRSMYEIMPCFQSLEQKAWCGCEFTVDNIASVPQGVTVGLICRVSLQPEGNKVSRSLSGTELGALGFGRLQTNSLAQPLAESSVPKLPGGGVPVCMSSHGKGQGNPCTAERLCRININPLTSSHVCVCSIQEVQRWPGSHPWWEKSQLWNEPDLSSGPSLTT